MTRKVERAPTVASLTALLGAALAWTAHLLGSYMVVGLSCAAGGRRAGSALGAVTAACVIAALASGLLGYRRLRAARSEGVAPDETLMLIGVLSAPLFTVAIVLEAVVPAFVLLCPAS